MIEPRTILLVEDDANDALLVERALGKTGFGFQMARARHGDEAIDYLSGVVPFEDREAHPFPNVVLLDIKLPRRSGFEVLDWIRSQQTDLSRLPVVMLSSSAQTIDVSRAYDLGANAYLTKPESSRQLQEMMVDFQKFWLRWNESPDLSALA